MKVKNAKGSAASVRQRREEREGVLYNLSYLGYITNERWLVRGLERGGLAGSKQSAEF
jgi:hypothetical protein